MRAKTIRATRCNPLYPLLPATAAGPSLALAHSRTAWAYHHMLTTCKQHPSSCAMRTSGLRQLGLPAATRYYPLEALYTAGLHGRTMPAHNLHLNPIIMRHAHFRIRQSGLLAAIHCIRCCPVLPGCYPLLPAATRCYPLQPLGPAWRIAHSRTAWAHHHMHTTCNCHPSSHAMRTSGVRQSGLRAAARCYPMLPTATRCDPLLPP